MKINKPANPLPSGQIGESTARGAAKGKASSSPVPQRPDSTSVSLGSTATQLNSLESSMANTPIIDSAKVAKIKQAISDGRFKVNSEVVADRLIATVHDLIDNKA